MWHFLLVATSKKKKLEKIQKYQDLRLKIQKMWNLQALVIPVVICALRATSTEIKKHLGSIPEEHKIVSVMKLAVLESAHILRKVLNLRGI